MAAMALYAVNKVFYPKRTWRTPRPETVKGAFRVAVCVCCYKEPTETVAGALQIPCAYSLVQIPCLRNTIRTTRR